MHRVWTAIRAFFAALVSGETARRVDEALRGPTAAALEAPKPKPKEPPKPKAPLRSEAVTLLSALQREARFIDFVQEPLAGYSDAQIGAAARDVHRDCGAVLQRLFAIRPVVDEEEGAAIEVPAGFDSGRYRLTGNVTGEPPFRGRVAHHGWEAAKCDLPEWTGSKTAARTIAPAEVECE